MYFLNTTTNPMNNTRNATYHRSLIHVFPVLNIQLKNKAIMAYAANIKGTLYAHSIDVRKPTMAPHTTSTSRTHFDNMPWLSAMPFNSFRLPVCFPSFRLVISGLLSSVAPRQNSKIFSSFLFFLFFSKCLPSGSLLLTYISFHAVSICKYLFTIYIVRRSDGKYFPVRV